MALKFVDPNALTLFDQKDSFISNPIDRKEKKTVIIRPPLREPKEIVQNNTGIRETAKIPVYDVRVTSGIIRQMARVIRKEVEQADRGDMLCLYSIGCETNSFDSGKDTFFEEGEILNERKILNLSMKFQTESNDKNIKVSIHHSIEESKHSFIEISGTDSIWVKGIMKNFEEILDQCEKRPQILKKLGHISLPLWLLSFFLCYRVMDTYGLIQTGSLLSPIILSCCNFLSAWGFYEIAIYVTKMWPSVELVTGPDHLHDAEAKRRLIYWIGAEIIIPITLTTLFETLKYFHIIF